MATWTQVNNVSYWSWSHVADLGPYTGTLPLLVPAWIPDEAAEIDFVVGRPHPSGDVARFQDGTYDEGDVAGSYQYHSGQRLLSGKYGRLTTLDPSMHLFVQFFRSGYPSNPTAAPSLPPLALVPGALVPGGYGPTRGAGKWSEWFPGWNTSHNLTHVDNFYGQRAVHTPITAGDDTSALINSQLADLVAGHGTAGADFFDAPWQQPATFISVDRTGAVPGTGSVFTAISYRGFTIDQANIESGPARGYPSNLPDIAVLGQLDDGMVVDDNTWTDNQQNVIQYQSRHLTFIDWGQGRVAATPIAALYDSEATVFGGGGSPSFVPSSQDIQLVTGVHGDVSTTTESTFWGIKNRGPDDITWGSLTHRNAGNQIGLGVVPNADIVANGEEHSYGLSSAIYGPNAPYSSEGTPEPLVFADPVAPDVWTAPVDLPGVTASRFSVIVLPSLGGRDDSFVSTNAVNGEHTQVYSLAGLWRGVVVTGLETDFYPIVHTPPWRYWISGELVFHCPPGYSPKATVIEGHWSEWQPGYVINSADIVGSVQFSVFGRGADVGCFSRINDSAHDHYDHSDMLPALLASQAGITSGTEIDSVRVQAPAAAAPLVGTNMVQNSPNGYGVRSTLGYAAFSVEPANYLPPMFSNNEPALLLNATQGLDYDVIPSSHLAEIHHTAYYDSLRPEQYVDWEAASSTWLHWTTMLHGITLRVTYYYAHGDASGPADWRGPDVIPIEIGSTAWIPGGGISDFAPTLAPDVWPSLSNVERYDVGPLFVVNDGDFQYDLFRSDAAVYPISGQPRKFATVVRTGWLTDPGNVPYINPALGAIASLDAKFASSVDPWPAAMWRTPRWRYWIPTITSYECVAGAVRMTQRDDGLGISRHPRLNLGNAPSSQQANRAARVNRGNTYS